MGNGRTNGFAQEHPTGIGTVVGAGLIALLEELKVVEFSQEGTLLIVAGVAAVISLFTPRWRRN